MRVCVKCGKLKVKAKRGPATCLDCQRDRKATRPCRECKRERAVPREIGTRGRTCFECQDRIDKDYQRRYRETHREQIAARIAKWHRENPERKPGYERKRWQRIRSDPKAHEHHLHQVRFYKYEKAEREGHPITPREGVGKFPHQPPALNNHSGEQLPTEPLVNWLRYEYPDLNISELALLLHEDDAHLHRLMTSQQWVSLHVADRIFTAADCPHLLALLYPLEAAA